MAASKKPPRDVDAYLALFPETIRQRLVVVRAAVRFPHDRPLPRGLIGKIVKIRARENRQR